MVTDKQPFKGLENYFTDFLLYGAESDTKPSVQETNNSEESDTEAGLDYDGDFVLNDTVPFVINLDGSESSDENYNWQLAEGVINNNLEYLPCLDDVMQGLYNNPDIHMPLRSSYMTKMRVQGSFGTTLILPAKAGVKKRYSSVKGSRAHHQIYS